MKYLRSMPLIFVTVLLSSLVLTMLKIAGKKKMRQKLQTAVYQATIKIWRIKITQIGQLAPPPAMIIANHCSYLDVAFIGSLGAMRFTPKSEVKNWFLIGRVVRAFDVIFIDRNPKRTQQVKQELQQAMQQGGRLCIFPEGTTNNGLELKPFKSSMFSLINDPQINLQPIAIKYKSVDGTPMNPQIWENIAWFGDAALIPHMWRLGRFRHIEVEVHCLPIIATNGANRKELAQQAEQMIKNIVMS